MQLPFVASSHGEELFVVYHPPFCCLAATSTMTPEPQDGTLRGHGLDYVSVNMHQ